MWFDRLTQQDLIDLPMQVEPSRYHWQGKNTECLNGHSVVRPGALLPGDGRERCQLYVGSYSFVLPESDQQTKITLFANAINTIGNQLNQSKNGLLSPLLPAAVIDSESQLLPVEKNLSNILLKGHLHQISQRPRLDIRYEEEVTDIARAKRLAKGALVHLASHSECWQRQTLSGIVPKKVKARFSEDEFHIYENRVYAYLLDKLDIHLTLRMRTVEQLNNTLDQALDFYNSDVVYYRLARKVCELWGQTFDQDATQEAQNLLGETLQQLKDMHKAIRALKQSGLYPMLHRQTQVVGSLYRTNILTHDAHYRHLTTLWDELNKHQQKLRLTPAESFQHQKQLAENYSRYTGLVLQHALQPYLTKDRKNRFDAEQLTTTWAGKELILKRSQHDWKLFVEDSSGDAMEVLHVIPWMGFTELSAGSHIKSHQIIVHPSLEGVPQDSALSADRSIALSPTDLYCVERIGWLIDQKLNEILISNYTKPIDKIPTTLIQYIKSDSIGSFIEIINKKPPALKVTGDLPADRLSKLCKQLNQNNAKDQAMALKTRVLEIQALQICPVCESSRNILHKQPYAGFQINCPHCKSSRYLRNKGGGYEFELKLPDIDNSFQIKGRWYK